MNLLNKTKFYILFFLCALQPLQAQETLVPILINTEDNKETNYLYTTTEKQNKISLYQFNRNEFWPLWEYRFDPNKNITYLDVVSGDISGNGQNEIVALIYSYEHKHQLYVFKTDANIPLSNPEIYTIQNIHNNAEPIEIETLKADKDKDKEIIISFASPARKVLLFDYAVDELIAIENIGNKFMGETWGPIFLSLNDTTIVLYSSNEKLQKFIYNKKTENKSQLIDSQSDEQETSILQQVISKKDGDILFFKNGKIYNNKMFQYDKNILKGHRPNENKIVLYNKDQTITKIEFDFVNKKIIPLDEHKIPTKEKVHTILIDTTKLLISYNDNIEIIDLENFIITKQQKTKKTKPNIQQETVEGDSTQSTKIEIDHPQEQSDTIYINTGEQLGLNVPINKEQEFVGLETLIKPKNLKINPETQQFSWEPNKQQLGYNQLKFIITYKEKTAMTTTNKNDQIELNTNYLESEEKHNYILYVNDIPEVIFNSTIDTIKANHQIEIPYKIKDKNKEQTHTITQTNNQDFGLLITEEKLLWEPTKENAGLNIFKFIISDKTTENTATCSIFVDTTQTKTHIKNNLIATTNKEFTFQLPHKTGNTYKIKQGPTNLRVTQKGQIYWIPLITQINNNSVEILIKEKEESYIYKLEVYVNSPPIISYRPAEKETITQGASFSFICQSFDSNQNAPLYWSINNNIPNDSLIKISKEGKITIITDSLIDNINYNIILSDTIDLDVFSGMLYVNDTPKIISTPPQHIQLGDTLVYTIEVKDQNKERAFAKILSNKIYFTLTSHPEDMQITEQGEIFWIPTVNSLGDNYVNVLVTDSIATTSQAFNILVNSAPSITSIDSLSIELGDTLIHKFDVQDLNQNNDFSYTIKTTIEELLFNTKQGKLTWIPKQEDLGLHTIKIGVSDGFNQSTDTQKLKIFVYKKPELLNKPPTEAFINMEYSYKPEAQNMYNENIINEDLFILPKESNNLFDEHYNEEANEFYWIPNTKDIGLHTLDFIVQDRNNIQQKHTFTLNVLMSPCETTDTLFNDKTQPTKIDTVFINSRDTIIIEKRDTINTTQIDSIYINETDSTKIISKPKKKQFNIKTFSPWEN